MSKPTGTRTLDERELFIEVDNDPSLVSLANEVLARRKFEVLKTRAEECKSVDFELAQFVVRNREGNLEPVPDPRDGCGWAPRYSSTRDDADC